MLCFDDEGEELLHLMDTKKDGDPFFQTVHLSWYNRYATKGYEAPIDLHPLMMEREDASHTNHSQTIPYLSQDAGKHKAVYDNVKTVLADLFEWLRQWLESNLPEEYELLMSTAATLPGNCTSPVLPFLGLVINLNVNTKGHRDPWDKDFCLVMPIGDFQG
ncbi:hypothetical protein M405DRAFT_746022, partial [Rhizopogon salebrosus TDB-379]